MWYLKSGNKSVTTITKTSLSFSDLGYAFFLLLESPNSLLVEGSTFLWQQRVPRETATNKGRVMALKTREGEILLLRYLLP